MLRSYEQIVKHIEAQRDLPARAGSFGRYAQALHQLVLERGLVFDEARTIVIAGTNGKGSTAKCLQTLLNAADYRTGLFTSPHLIDTTERIRIDGEPISHEEFVRAYAAIEDFAEKFTLGHFEILTLMAAEIFFSPESTLGPLEWKIFEVGVGGEFDPTRLMPHATSVITRLGYDHEKILGSSMADIARAKLGIVDDGNLLVHAPWAEGAAEVATDVCARVGGQWIESQIFENHVEIHNGEPCWVVKTPWGSVTTDLIGARGVENLSTALRTFAALGFDPTRPLSALRHVRWPGRMEPFIVPGFKNKIYLSGDHNPQGVQSLIELLRSYSGPFRFVVGIAEGKNAEPMLNALRSLPAASIHLTQIPFRPRELSAYGRISQATESLHTDPMEALRHAQSLARAGERLIVTGSLYLVGDIRKQLLSIGGRPCQDGAQ